MIRPQKNLIKYGFLGLCGLTLAATFQNCNGFRNDSVTASSNSLSLASTDADLKPIYFVLWADAVYDLDLYYPQYASLPPQKWLDQFSLPTSMLLSETRVDQTGGVAADGTFVNAKRTIKTAFRAYRSAREGLVALKQVNASFNPPNLLGHYGDAYKRYLAQDPNKRASDFNQIIGYLSANRSKEATVPVYRCAEYILDISWDGINQWLSLGACDDRALKTLPPDGRFKFNDSFNGLFERTLIGYAIPADGALDGTVNPTPAAPQVSNVDTQITGNIDQVTVENNQAIVRGWACSTGMSDQVWVHVYAGSNEKNTFIGAVQANGLSERAVGTACGDGSGQGHRFSFNVSADNAQKYSGQLIFAYGISPAGKSNNPLLPSGSFKIPPVKASASAALKWSSAGPIANTTCVKIHEPSEPAGHAWDDNFLCSTQDYGLKYSNAGPLPGMACTSLNEPSDPHTWADNYLCAPKDIGLKFSNAGPIAGMRCELMNEPSDPDTWVDNYVCIP